MIYTTKSIDFFKNISSGMQYKETSKEISIRCPYCGDSKKDLTKKRFYISKTQPTFICFNCGRKGNIQRLFNDYGVSITNENKNEYFNNSININTYDAEYYTRKNNISYSSFNNDMTNEQFEYFKKRFIDFSKNDFDFLSEKIIYNIDYIWKNIEHNKIYDEKWLSSQYKDLKNSIGFITYNNNKIAFRNLNKNLDFRYKNFSLTNEDYFSDYFSFYTPKYENNFSKPFSIVVAEGSFDILNIYLKNLQDDADFYISSQSNNYSMIIKFLLTNTNKSWFNIYFYIDTDYNVKNLDNFYFFNKKYINTMNIFFNSNNKDFGEGHINKRLLKKY